MTTPYDFQPELLAMAEIPENGILSQPFASNDRVRVTLFGLSAGQEMTEHATPKEAIVHFLSGEIEVTVDGETHLAKANSWLRMDPGTRHSLIAKTPARFYLIVLR